MHASRVERAERLGRRAVRVCDGLLDVLVLAFAAWTVVYHACLVLDLGAAIALAAWAAVVVPGTWLWLRTGCTQGGGTVRGDDPPRRRLALPLTAVRAAHVLVAVLAAALFAFTDVPWALVWIAWFLAAAGTVVVVTLAAADRPEEPGATGQRQAETVTTWPATLLALAWAPALAVLSLFLVRPDGDDTLYVRLSTWIAAYGEFPLRDVVFSDEGLPAVIYPPVTSFEALVGAVSYVTGLSAAGLVYLVATPVASALAVLAVWRLLRTWGLAKAWLALSLALLFLLADAGSHRTLGNFFVARLWQGKVVFLAVLVPLLFVFLHDYVRRPTTRGLVLLAAGGAAAVGLSSTAVFVAPVVAAGCLLPLLRRSPRTALAGLAGVCAYPVLTAAVTVAVGSRRAADYPESAVDAELLTHFVLGDGVLAFLALAAVLLGPVLLTRATPALMTAGVGLLVTSLFAPEVPRLVYDVTDLGRVLWRLTWALPIAALVGVLLGAALERIRRPALSALALAAVGVVLLVAGTPVWSASAGTRVASEPSWKRPAWTTSAARRVLAEAGEGDVILAPERLSQTIIVRSGRVTTVAPRRFYVRALRDVPGAHAEERLLLLSFATNGLGSPGETDEPAVVRALRIVGVDIACVPADEPDAHELLVDAGYRRFTPPGTISCFSAESSSR